MTINQHQTTRRIDALYQALVLSRTSQHHSGGDDDA